MTPFTTATIFYAHPDSGPDRVLVLVHVLFLPFAAVSVGVATPCRSRPAWIRAIKEGNFLPKWDGKAEDWEPKNRAEKHPSKPGRSALDYLLF